jgi:hypothetical protein
MADKPTGLTEKPPKDHELSPRAQDFLRWMQGRSGFTIDELIDTYSREANLTPTQTANLRREIKEYLKRTKPPEPGPPKPPTPGPPKPPKPGLKITRIPYPRWWADSLNAKIDITAPDTKTLATVSGKLKLYAATIVMTVTGETQVTINFGKAGSSGPLYLGGEGQPMGIVIAMGESPAPCGQGNLTITATDPQSINPKIGGFATCFVEEV